jgi:hypothetical protein
MIFVPLLTVSSTFSPFLRPTLSLSLCSPLLSSPLSLHFVYLLCFCPLSISFCLSSSVSLLSLTLVFLICVSELSPYPSHLPFVSTSASIRSPHLSLSLCVFLFLPSLLSVSLTIFPLISPSPLRL